MKTFAEVDSLDYNSGDVGGDVQASNAASRRFTRTTDDGTYETVTVYTFASDEYFERDATYEVVELTETIEHTDPEEVGGTELHSEYEYDFPYERSFDTAQEAFDAGVARLKNIESSWF